MRKKTQVFQLVRYSVPAEWSDWAVDRLVERLVTKDNKDQTRWMMPRGITHEQRKTWHRETAEWRVLVHVARICVRGTRRTAIARLRIILTGKLARLKRRHT